MIKPTIFHGERGTEEKRKRQSRTAGARLPYIPWFLFLFLFFLFSILVHGRAPTQLHVAPFLHGHVLWGAERKKYFCTYDKFSTFPIQFDHLSTSCTVLLSSPLLLSSLSAALLSAREEEEEEDDKRSLLSLGSSLTLYTAS